MDVDLSACILDGLEKARFSNIKAASVWRAAAELARLLAPMEIRALSSSLAFPQDSTEFLQVPLDYF